VFCVSNVSSAYSATDLAAHIFETTGIAVITCGDTKTRFTDTKAFRVCIAAADAEKFVEPDYWPYNVIVRRWVWKGKRPNEQQDTNNPSNDG